MVVSDLPATTSPVSTALTTLQTQVVAPTAASGQAKGVAIQSVAQSTAVAIADGSTYMRNVTTMATAAIGVALAQLVATKDPQWATVITNAQTAVTGAATNFKEIGTAAAEVLKAFPGGS